MIQKNNLNLFLKRENQNKNTQKRKERMALNPLYIFFSFIFITVAVLTGCGGNTQTLPDLIVRHCKDMNFTKLPLGGQKSDEEAMVEVLSGVYSKALKANAADSPELLEYVIDSLGSRGYVAVDWENQVNMENGELALAFCTAVEQRRDAELTILSVAYNGEFRTYDIKSRQGHVEVVRTYYRFDKNGALQYDNQVRYFPGVWEYTEEGYLIFEGSYYTDENYILTYSDTLEHVALRILPLDKTCRELNRKYILPIGYSKNNLLLTDWSEQDFGELDFYDLFERFFTMLYGYPSPCIPDDDVNTGVIYQIPASVFEYVTGAYLKADRRILVAKGILLSEDGMYLYKPRGFYEGEYPDIPYPEVTEYTENQDGTITLTVNAVYPEENTSRAFSHRTVICPLSEEDFQYVSNEMIPPEKAYDHWWHSNRLTEEAWQDLYGGNILWKQYNMLNDY